MTDVRFLFDGDGWRPDGAPRPESAEVVDSWTLESGVVRRLPDHLARFAGAAHAQVPEVPDARLVAFLSAVAVRYPDHGPPHPDGDRFPRIELHRDPVRFVLWDRPIPPRSTAASLWVPPGPDPRRAPLRKGPDLAVLAGLREQARRNGHDDALLRGPDGAVREAAHAGLVWWSGDTLCQPAATTRLRSVTTGALTAAAHRKGVTLRSVRARVEDLAGQEVWLLNALHGIRVVTSVGDRDCAAPRPARLDRARRALGWREQVASG